MTLDFHALWILTGVAAAVFVALSAATWRACGTAAFAFAVTTGAGLWLGPPPAGGTGLFVALAAVTVLLRPRAQRAAPFIGGVLAGIWGIMLAAQDVPLGGAIAAAATVALAAAWCARQPGFAPPRIRDEALFVLTVLGVATAVVPGVQDGWRAAVNLSLQSSPAAAMPLPAWTLGVGVSALLLGALYSLWSRR